jgi:hypothetical protein
VLDLLKDELVDALVIRQPSNLRSLVGNQARKTHLFVGHGFSQ